MIFILCAIFLIAMLVISVKNIVSCHRRMNVVGLKNVRSTKQALFWIIVFIECVAVVIIAIILGSETFSTLGIGNPLEMWDDTNGVTNAISAIAVIITLIAYIVLTMAFSLVAVLVMLLVVSITLNIYVAVCISRGYKVTVIYLIALYLDAIALLITAVTIICYGVEVLVALV